MLVPYQRQGIKLQTVFGDRQIAEGLPDREYWQLPSSVALAAFLAVGLFGLRFVDDVDFDDRLWLQRRNGNLEAYFCVSVLLMKGSQVVGLAGGFYQFQIAMNCLLKWGCLAILKFTNPIFNRKERVLAYCLAFFNIWLSTSQVMKLVSLADPAAECSPAIPRHAPLPLDQHLLSAASDGCVAGLRQGR